MSLSDSIIGARQFVSAFTGQCLYLAACAALIGVGAGCWAMHHWDAGAIAKSELQLANFRDEMAENTSATLLHVNALQAENARLLQERERTITASIDNLPSQVANLLRPQFQALRNDINAPQYDCLRNTPLPSAYLGRLRRAGGNAASTGNGSAQVPTAASGM
jgi:hypothetical protein